MNSLLSKVLLKPIRQGFALKGAEALPLPVTPLITGFCVGMWWRSSHTLQDMALFNWEATFNNSGINLRQNTGGAIQIIGAAAAVVNINASFAGFAEPRVPLHVVLTYAANVARIYKNGVEILNATGVISSNVNSPTVGRAAFGSSYSAVGIFRDITYQTTTTRWTQAQIDDLRLKNKVPNGAIQWRGNNRFTDQNNLNRILFTGKPNFSNEIPSQQL